jgi:hypothetical protein
MISYPLVYLQVVEVADLRAIFQLYFCPYYIVHIEVL